MAVTKRLLVSKISLLVQKTRNRAIKERGFRSDPFECFNYLNFKRNLERDNEHKKIIEF